MENLSKIIYSGNVGHLIYPYIWVNSNITSNTTINQPITFTNDVVINTGITLTVNSTMKMTSDCKIIVKPGAKLIVDGGVLTNACFDKTWYGIHISGNDTMPQTSQYQGAVELKNSAIIENARFALMTYDLEDNYSTTGGIIYAENTTFKNNRKSAVFWAYPPTGLQTIRQNVSYFKNCTFIVDDSNLFENSGFEFESHISMWGVTGVKIYGCTFENNTSNTSNRYKAIYTENAGYIIDQQCSSYNLTSCECKNAPTPSVFKGFDKAIVSTGSGSQYAIRIDRSHFSNNITGISFKGFGNFQLSRLNMSSETPYNNFPTGIYIDKCTGYKIEGNEIYSNGDQNSTGIHINHPGRDENKIYRNRIYKTGYAIKTTALIPPGRDFPSTGLQFACNNMYENNNDIFVTAQSIIRSEQGSSNSGADNLFTQTGNYDLYVNSSNTVNYYYNNSITRKTPVNCTNNISKLNARANPCGSTLCASSISDTLGNGGITYKAKSSLTEYSELNKKYSEMMSYFYAKGFDKVLTNYYNDIIEDKKMLNDAMVYHAEILLLTEYMAEISNEALFALKTDSIIELGKIRDWYDEMYTLNAKYSLAETYYQMGKYNEGFKTLELIPKMFDLNEEEFIEHDNYVSLYNFKYGIMKSGRTIAELKKDEIEKLNGIAKKSYGLSSVMAQGVLCFFYDICYDNTFNEDTDEGLKSQKSIVNEITTNQNRITIYPNPGTDKITVISEIDNCNFELINVNGVTQTTYKLQKGINIFDISILVPGIYIYRVFNDGEIISEKWVKM
ncbi:MAG: T9SS type A sorting domain-containing protein [Bacteroidales bacterium]|jgi:hypothetical protein|nr:T9SS type A sorting domain-containing protein [Bacteroidales bacterium]